MRVIAIVEFERCVANAYILGIVVGKLSYQKELSSIILLVINKNSKISLHYTILPLNLAVSLRIEDNKEPLLDF